MHKEFKVTGKKSSFECCVDSMLRVSLVNEITSVYFPDKDIERLEYWLVVFNLPFGMTLNIRQDRACAVFTGANSFVFATCYDPLIPGSIYNFEFTKEECAEITQHLEELIKDIN